MLFKELVDVAASAPRTSGFRQNGVRHPLGALLERIERLAGGFQSIGIGEGDAVALFMPNSIDLFVVSHALFGLGAIAVPLNAQANARELHWSGEKCGLTAIVARLEAAPVAERLNADLGGALKVVLTGDGPGSVGALEKHAPANLTPIDPEANAIYVFSSGSTGRSKIVPWTQRSILAYARDSAVQMHTTAEDVFLNGLPSHHAFGYITAVGGEILAGATTVFWSDPQPIMLSKARMLAAVEAERVSVLPGVPFLFDLLASVPDNVDMSSIRLGFSSAVGLKRPTFERFRERFGVSLRQGLGMSEAGLVSVNIDGDADATWDSVGIPKAPVSVQILPSADAPRADVGELFIKTPGLTKGYLGVDAEANAGFRNGGMLTGDLGRLADDGRLYVTGRSKLIVEVSGMKVDPIEVEDVLASHPAVAEAVVVGVPDPRTGEQRLKAVVVRKGDDSAEDILRYSRQLLTPHKVPSLIEFRDAIPRSAAGKVLRGQLLD